MIDIFVTGIPKATPRTRAVHRGGKTWTHDAGTADDWKSLVMLALNPFSGSQIFNPVSVEMTFFFPRPKRLQRKKDPEWPIRHIAKPDVDNLEKCIFDVCTACGIWIDDKQVCRSLTEKWYVAKGDSPGCRIVIKEIT